ncbi:MAG: tetratricopeptide repeat protein [Gammaproteobacteria bacterium]
MPLPNALGYGHLGRGTQSVESTNTQAGFFERLKQHHIYRVAVGYGTAIAIGIQVVARSLPYFGWSSAVPAVIIILIASLPVVIVLAWLLVKPTDITQQTVWQKRHWKLGAIVTPLVIAAVVISGIYAFKFGEQHAERVAAEQAAAQAKTATPAAAPAIPAKSIAVLPFENLSTDKSNAYFADGIQDLILTKLADISDLKVISRTSTMQYGSHPGNLKSIALQLGVAAILEGSVQKVGNQVLINVQLINASSDSHIWADSYTRTLDNIFGVEGEVAQKIAAELAAKLTDTEQQVVSAQMTGNPAAYEAYLHGLVLEHKLVGFTPNAYLQIEKDYNEAVKLDPKFAQAWTQLSVIKTRIYASFIDRSPQMLAQAKQAVDTALQLDPRLGDAYLALARYYYLGLRDMANALPPLERARQLLPNNADVLNTLGEVEERQNKWRQANEHLRMAVQLDPRSVNRLVGLAYSYAALNQYARAREFLDSALVLAPNEPTLIAAKAGTYQQEGDLDAAGALLEGLPLTPGQYDVFFTHTTQYLYRRHYDDAIAAYKIAVSDPDIHREIVRAIYLSNYATVLQLAGQNGLARSTAMQALTELMKIRQSDADDHVLAYFIANAYAVLGKKDEALQWTHRDVVANSTCSLCKAGAEADLAAMQARFGDSDAALAALPHLLTVPNGLTVANLRLDPTWDPLRKDPRFQALLKKYAHISPVLEADS